MPPIPQSIEDISILGDWAKTWGGEQFVLNQDNDWGNLLFATDENLRKLSKCATIHVDGTFKTCPRPFSQFVTIHGMYHGRVLPFAFCLMSGKSIGHYRQFFKQLKDKIRELTRRRFKPTVAVCDFEMALITALRTELPYISVRACFFHFCQSLWRKIQDLGMATAYKRSKKLGKCLRKFMALAYLPLPLVRNNFDLHCDDELTKKCLRRFPRMQDFNRYITITTLMEPMNLGCGTFTIVKTILEPTTTQKVFTISGITS